MGTIGRVHTVPHNAGDVFFMALLPTTVFMVKQHPQVEHITSIMGNSMNSPNSATLLLYSFFPIFCLADPSVLLRDLYVYGHVLNGCVHCIEFSIQIKKGCQFCLPA